jgi:thiamine kinase-like enzyme
VHNSEQVNEVRKAFSLANSKNFFSPSDLGLHNSIENRLGFFFVDFEYAGLDSPLKMLFDLIANPSNQINSLELIDQDETIFRKYLSTLSSRQITDFHFLFMIKWYFILLNIILKQKPDVKVVENLKMLESKIRNFNG